MDKQTPKTLVEQFSSVSDPRIDRTKRHKLIDILVIAICATICGADGWEEFELFGPSKQDWCRTFLELPHGLPSDDTFRRVFGRIDPRQFQHCFLEWIGSVYELTEGQTHTRSDYRH
jgi:hypothetical protein